MPFFSKIIYLRVLSFGLLAGKKQSLLKESLLIFSFQLHAFYDVQSGSKFQFYIKKENVINKFLKCTIFVTFR